MMSQRKKSVPRYMDTTTSSSSRYTERKFSDSPKHNVSNCLDVTNICKAIRNETAGSSCSIVSSISNANPSHKYMQHKLDIAYNKYVQNKALKNYLTKKYKELDLSIDTQLSHFEEIYHTAVEDDENKKRLLCDIKMVQDAAVRIQFLENALDKTCNLISDEELIKKVDNFNEQLSMICDRLCLKKFEFEQSDENYNKLQQILKEISNVLEEISVDSNMDLLVILDSICKINNILVKLQKNRDNVQTYQTKVNSLTLKAASLEFSKKCK